MTKGKWKFRNVEGNHENIVIYTLKHPHGILNIYPGPDVVSNAQAIAAVPDLIEALQLALDVISRTYQVGHNTEDVEKIKAALIKAGQEVGR